MNEIILDLNTSALINYLERSVNAIDGTTAKLLQEYCKIILFGLVWCTQPALMGGRGGDRRGEKWES